MQASHETTRLRKRLLSILRQNSEYVQLYYDTYGYTPVEPLLAYIRTLKGCAYVTRSDLREVVENDPGRLFEWDQGDLICATHGFMPVVSKGRLAEAEPPEFLYYGTHKKLVRQAFAAGLLPIASEYVQLADRVEAIGLPAGTLEILLVKAREAHAAGTPFFRLASSPSTSDPYYFCSAVTVDCLEPL